MSTKTPKNFVLASNLMLLVFVLSVVHYFLPNIHILAGMLPFAIGIKVLILAIAIVLRQGYSWSKFLLLGYCLLSLTGFDDIRFAFTYPSVAGVIVVTQFALTIWATIVVFRKQ